jgi:hypothetical protein
LEGSKHGVHIDIYNGKDMSSKINHCNLLWEEDLRSLGLTTRIQKSDIFTGLGNCDRLDKVLT